MNWTSLLFGVLPLCVFVIVDSFSGLKAGIVSAIILAIVEAGYSWFVFHDIDGLTIGSFILVLVFGVLSYKTNNAMLFKVQPVILGVLFSAVLLTMQALGKPLMLLMAQKYQYALPSEMQDQINSPHMQDVLIRSSLWLGFGFLIHAGFVFYAARRLSNWWWLAIRGVGLYVMMIICMMGVSLTR